MLERQMRCDLPRDAVVRSACFREQFRSSRTGAWWNVDQPHGEATANMTRDLSKRFGNQLDAFIEISGRGRREREDLKVRTGDALKRVGLLSDMR